jgi:hypothetical protein
MIQVVILGDKVNSHLSLLEKIYVTLDHYSPTLQKHPGVSTAIKPHKCLLFLYIAYLSSWVLNPLTARTAEFYMPASMHLEFFNSETN